MIRFSIVVAAFLVSSCAEPTASVDAGAPVPPAPDRAEGDRTPRDVECDAVDPGRCLLPWPSNTFAVADPTTETGLRLEVDMAVMNWRDDGSSLSLADGFSRVSSILSHFEAPLDEGSIDGAVRLILAQPGHPDRGREVPLRVELISAEDGQTLLVADPREILEPAADYVVVVGDGLRRADGEALTPPRGTLLALGLEVPFSDEEAEIVGYHAPARALLDELGIDRAGVLRVWDFTTRSVANAQYPLLAMSDASLEAVDSGTAAVVIDSVEPSGDAAIEMIVLGHVSGLPAFLDEDRGFVPDADGNPTVLGTRDAPFRVVVPAGAGDYRYVMYAHGTGGNELDPAFDEDLAALGIAKVGVRIHGWGEDVIVTFSNLREAGRGSFGGIGFLLEAIAHARAVRRAMGGALADALAADTIAGMPNPAAGRRADGSTPMWVGGSLGGTTGLVFAAVDPEMRYAVINTPGAAWSQWIWQSDVFNIIHSLLRLGYADDVDLGIALAIGQTNFDYADGTSWGEAARENPTAFLVQESMGDPILPNPGTEMAALAAGAAHVGGILEPIVGIAPAEEVIEGSGITQFRTTGSIFDIHGFAATDSPAGAAAREQILEFISTAFAGSSRIAPPPSCPAAGCDFATP